MGFKVSKFMLNIFEYPLVDQRSRDFKKLWKKLYLVCYSPVLDTFFSALLRKKLELTGP